MRGRSKYGERFAPALSLGERLALGSKRNRRTGCLEWQRSTDGVWGYGILRYRGKNHRVHIIAYRLRHGKIPEGKWVLHRCDNPACLEPKHLFLGTHADNMADMVAKGRSRHSEAHSAKLRGEKNGQAKLTERQAREILVSTGKCADVGDRYGVSAMIVSKIRRRLLWKHI